MNKLYRNSNYLSSAHQLSQLPADQGREVAFAGRSNAGKSSAINAITDCKMLARVSRTPGRTQMINHFEVCDDRFLVDLPGYGYAKVPDKTRTHWHRTLQQYFEQRQSLIGLMLIMDARHPLQPLDRQMIDWCESAQLNLHIVLTKADKLSRGAAQKALLDTQKTLENAGVTATLQLFSALKKQGIEDAHTMLDKWLSLS